MHFITDSLLVGNLDDARRPPPYVKALLFLAEEQEVTPPPGLFFARVPFKEFAEPDPLKVLNAVEWLERHADSQRVMVCCRAGMGRSVSVIIAYLCCIKGMQYTEAVKLLSARRPGASPLPRLEAIIEKVKRLRREGTPLPRPDGTTGDSQTASDDR